MGAASAILLLALGASRNLSAIVLDAAVLGFTLNFSQAVLLAVVPDRVAPDNRALASWAFGFGGPVGAFAGVNIGALTSSLGCCAILATLLSVSVGVFVVFAPEGSALHLADGRRPPETARAGLLPRLPVSPEASGIATSLPRSAPAP